MLISHLTAFRALDATLREGSQSAAANALGVTPAAVAQQIKTLEAGLGYRLFERVGGRLVPTAAAKDIEYDLRTVFEGLAGVIDRLQAPSTRLSVTLPVSFAENWFTQRLPSLYGKVGEIDLRIDASNRMVDLRSGLFDFALRYSGEPGSGLAELPLFGDWVLPLASAEFAQTHDASLARGDLNSVPIVDLGQRTPDPDWVDWRRWALSQGLGDTSPQNVLKLTNFSSGLRAALSGQGLVLCGLVEAFDAIESGRLVAPFGMQAAVPTGYKYRLVWPENRTKPRLFNRFRSWIKEEAAQFCEKLDRLMPV